MKLKIILICMFILTATMAYSSANKTINLKDGTTIIGEIIKFEHGRYTIKTSHLGNIIISDENILSIMAEGVKVNSPSLKQEVGSIQGQIMSNPKIMESINALTQDEEIRALLQNPELINTIMSFDENKIMNDQSIQQLLQREDIQKIMLEIQQSISGN